MEIDFGCSLLEVLTELPVLLIGGFKLAPRPGIFTVLHFHKVNVPLTGGELT